MTTTNLRDEIVSALKRSPQGDLLAIVLQYKARGLSQRAAHDTLQSIWIDLGCQKAEMGGTPICEALESLMDRVWGYCPARDAIWDSTLSGMIELEG